MKESKDEKPHIVMVQITIAVLVVGQMINAYQERQAHREIWDSLTEIQRELELSIENQNLHLTNVQDFADDLLETLQH